jgi:ABC-type glycerol-3-phosphate transport system substrate-binding protein
MPKHLTSARQFLIAGLLILMVAVTAGCDRLSQVLTPEPTPLKTVTAGRATGTVAPAVSPTEPASTPTPSIVGLTLWTTEELGPVGQSPGQRLLSAQIAAFEAANPGVKVNVVLKKPYGEGGMLDFLASTAAAVPAALPDVAILDIREVGSAAQQELIQPLDGWVTPEIAQDLVAPARTAGQVSHTWFGLPFQADVQHLIYNTMLVATAPVTWTDVLSSTVQYLFPAGGRSAVAGEGGQVNDAFVIQYFGTGAYLTGESGQPALDRDAVTAVLQFYADGLAAGVIPESAIKYTSVDDVWPIYLSEEVGLANTSAHRYLESRESFRKSSFAPIPTQDGTVASVFRGWAYVLVAEQPERQKLAWSLIEWLTNPDRLGKWALAAGYLPTRLSAWPEDSDDDYLKFLAELLQNSRVRPTGPAYDEAGRALQRAVQAVFTGSATPAEAAAQAVDSIP